MRTVLATYASFYFEPQGVIAWIVIGLVAGALAGRVVRGKGYGCLVDIFIGIVGSMIGGALLGGFIHGGVGFIESIVVAFIGAVALLALVRLVTGR